MSSQLFLDSRKKRWRGRHGVSSTGRRRKAKLDAQKAKLNSENGVSKGNARQPAAAATSSAEKLEAAAIASLSELIEEDIVADL